MRTLGLRKGCRIARLAVCVLLLRLGSLVQYPSSAWAGSAVSASADSSARVAADSNRVVRILPAVEVVGSSVRSLAPNSAASQGLVTPRQVAERPLLRTGDVLETVPGLLISQHSGEGKANQYYLRGFNLDHGTDFATTIAGVPVNMPTHAHGQGYTDLSHLIPELIGGIEYRKGTYSAEDGDFASAGSAHITYRTRLAAPLVSVTAGEEGYGRLLAGSSTPLGAGSILGAIELVRNDGPWVHPDDYRKFNGLVLYSRVTTESTWNVTAAGYDGRWNASDQVPERAVAAGTISRFGAVDPTDGGTSHRYSLSAEFQDGTPQSLTRGSAYLLAYQLDLFSNFTYFLTDTLRGDQIEQSDQRTVAGLHLSHASADDWLGGQMVQTVGVDARYDDIGKIGLYQTEARRRLSTVREDRVLEASASPFVEVDLPWTAWLRTILGARADAYYFNDASSYAPFSGDGLSGLVSPKASLILGPWNAVSLYLNGGYGFHSDDARGARSSATGGPSGVQAAPEHIPVPGGPDIERTSLLVRTKGAEVGARCEPGTHGWVAGSLWGLDMDSEHVFHGDAGLTAPTRPSRRTGIELSGMIAPDGGIHVDADFAYSRARFRDEDPTGDHIPGAVEGVASAGVAVERPSGATAALRLRYFGPRPLTEDNAVRSPASTVLSADAGYHAHASWALTLQAFNVLDHKVSDVDYYYVSRLPGEPASGVADIHTHPQGPRSLRLVFSIGEP